MLRVEGGRIPCRELRRLGAVTVQGCRQGPGVLRTWEAEHVETLP